MHATVATMNDFTYIQYLKGLIILYIAADRYYMYISIVHSPYKCIYTSTFCIYIIAIATRVMMHYGSILYNPFTYIHIMYINFSNSTVRY